MENPCKLPNDFRLGIYTPHDGDSIVCTVDAVLSRSEILMHDETNDIPFSITPLALRTLYARVATKKGDGLDCSRLQGKKVIDLGGLGYGLC